MKRTKVLVIDFFDFDDPHLIGIVKKVRTQCEAFRKAGFEVTHITPASNRIRVDEAGEIEESEPIGNKVMRRNRLAKRVSDMPLSKYAGCYIRFQYFDGAMLKILRALRQNGVASVVEVPTYPYHDEMALQGPKGYMKLACDALYRRRCVNLVNRFAVTADIPLVFDRQPMRMTNGIDIENTPVSHSSEAAGTIECVTVSSMMPWHGYDRAINGLAEYLKKMRGSEDARPNIVLHMVGDGTERENYEHLADELGISDNVIFHGMLSGAELDRVIDSCSIGIGSLGLHRIGQPNVSTLKSREYTARGLLNVTCGGAESSLELADYEISVPSDDTSLSYDGIVAMHRRVLNGGFAGAKRKMREYAERNFSMSATLAPVIEYIGNYNHF